MHIAYSIPATSLSNAHEICGCKHLPSGSADCMYRAASMSSGASPGIAEDKGSHDRLTYSAGVFSGQCVDRLINISQVAVSAVITLHNKRAPAPNRKLVHSPDNPAHGVVCQRPHSLYTIFFKDIL